MLTQGGHLGVGSDDWVSDPGGSCDDWGGQAPPQSDDRVSDPPGSCDDRGRSAPAVSDGEYYELVPFFGMLRYVPFSYRRISSIRVSSFVALRATLRTRRGETGGGASLPQLCPALQELPID